MKLYIKTPFVDGNKFIPHLLEHCVLSQSDPQNFLKYQKDTSAWTSTGYTGFEREDLAIEDFFALLQKPVSEEAFNRELQSITKELHAPSFGQKIYEKILRKICWPKIITNKVSEVSLESLQAYQKKRYQAENTILIDHEGKIIPNRGKAKELITISLSPWEIPELHCDHFEYRKEPQNFLWTPYQNPEEIFFLDYIGEAIEAYLLYQINKKGEYFCQTFDWSLTDSHLILTLSEALPKIQKSDFLAFLPYFKKDYLEKLNQGRYRSRDGLIALFIGKICNKEEHRNFIEKINHTQVETMTKKFFWSQRKS